MGTRDSGREKVKEWVMEELKLLDLFSLVGRGNR
jgi:hypothetical protein